MFTKFASDVWVRRDRWRKARIRYLKPLLLIGFLLATLHDARPAQAQIIGELTVEIKTGDVRFAGTDDDIHLEIGGLTLPLDNPDRDDFERNNTDTFVIDLPGRGLDLAWLRELGTLAVVKTEDSFWGGGWRFKGIRIFAEDATLIYENNSINRWLDGGSQDPDRTWRTDLSDPGWNLPEPPPPWPPCTIFPDVDGGGSEMVDSDCDGIPDESDDSLDTPTDTDGDGLPDAWETQNGEDPLTPDEDIDEDGWRNTENVRSVLVLTSVEALDEGEDIGRDELYLVAEDIRYPANVGLTGYWALNDDDVIAPNIFVDVRVASGLSGIPAPEQYQTRFRLRESDFEWFESPTDDTYTTFELRWPTTDPIVFEHEGGDEHYRLTFESLSLPFLDPSLTDPDGDVDGDQLSESLEFLISTQDATVQPTSIDGYDGLADPAHRELFVEIDAGEAAHAVPFDAIQAVASRYHYNGISPRFDALVGGDPGYLGGGQLLDTGDTLTLSDLDNFKADDATFASERLTYFRYGIFAEEINCAGVNGCARGPSAASPNRADQEFLVSRATMLGEFSAIVLLHELGHTLSLCHPEPDANAPVLGTACTDYSGVSPDDVTAMGSDIGADSIVVGAVAGCLIGGGIGFVGGPWGAAAGCVVGGILGAIIGLFNSDAWLRTIDYHPNEWDSLLFFNSVVTAP